MRFPSAATAVLGLFVAASAFAQTQYTVSSSTQTYSPLAGATIAPMTTMSSYPAKDEGYAMISLGFTFPFYGNNYTIVMAQSNGLLIFGSVDQAKCNYTTGDLQCTDGLPGIPDPTAGADRPHNFIAPWWSDLMGTSSGSVRYVKTATSITIEYSAWSYYPAGSPFHFKVKLEASGNFQVHYGSNTAFGGNNIIAGFEDSTGANGHPFKPCASKTSAFGCDNADWPTNTLYSVNAGGVTFTPSSAAFGVQRVNIASAPINVTVKNTATGSTTLSAASITPSQYTYSGPSLPLTLAPNGTTTFALTFTPTAVGPVSGTFSVTSTAPGSPHVLQLSGTGAQPTLSVAPASIDFGFVGINSAAVTRTLTLTNSGQVPLALSSANVAGPGFSVTGFTASTLAPGDKMTLTVSFAPTVTGAHSGTLSIASDDPTSPKTVALSGSGIAPVLAISPATVAFPDTNLGATSAPVTLTLSNTGAGPLTIAGYTAGQDFTVTGISPGMQIAEGASKTATVAFAPKMQGAITGTLTVTSDDSGSPDTVALSGTGRGPVLTLTPSPVDFGQVDISQSKTATLTLSNPGDGTLTIQSFAFTGPQAGDFSVDNPPAMPLTIAPAGSAAMTLKFTPKGHLARTATLELMTNLYPNPKAQLTVQGSGQGPKPAVSPASLDFGNVNVPQTGNQTLTVTNTGEKDLVISAIAFSGTGAAAYNTNATLPLTIPATANAQVTISFKPTTLGIRTATATLTTNDTLTPTVDVALTGTGVSPDMAITPTLVDFGKVRVSQQGTAVVTVRNNGTSNLNVTATAISGADGSRFVTPTPTPMVVVPNASSAISVQFNPIAVGVASATLTIQSDDPNKPSATVTLIGTGTSPNVVVAPATLSFGAQQLGRTSGPRVVTIENTGSAGLFVSSVAVTGQHAAQFIVSDVTTPFSLQAGEQKQVTVTCRPSSAADLNGELNIATDDPVSPNAKVSLSALGVSKLLSVTPTQVSFGIVRVGATSAEQEIRITNISGDTLALAAPVVSGASPEDFTVASFGGSLATNGVLVAKVKYRPVVARDSTATILFGSTDSRVTPVEVAVDGKGLSKVLEVAPATYDFGAIALGQSGETTVTVTNKSAEELSVTALKASNAVFTVEPSGAMKVPASANLPLTIKFTPALQGTETGSISLTLEGASDPEAVIQLSGSAVTSTPKTGGCCSGAPGIPATVLAAGLFALLRRRSHRRK